MQHACQRFLKFLENAISAQLVTSQYFMVQSGCFTHEIIIKMTNRGSKNNVYSADYQTLHEVNDDSKQHNW